MTKILVSICIPTYNRAGFLKKSIESIIRQPEFKMGKVEIAVSDNVSTDNTEALCREYAAKYDNIRYYRNEENCLDRNFPVSLSRGRGIFRKLCNDTLSFHENTLSYICNAVEKYEAQRPVLFFTNGNKKCRPYILDSREFILHGSFYLTWIGGFGIWDTDCDRILHDECYENSTSHLWQVYKIVALLAKKNAGVIFDEHVFDIQNAKKNPGLDYGYSLYTIFYQNYLRIIKSLLGTSLGQEDLDYLEQDLLYNFFTDYVVEWEILRGYEKCKPNENLKESIWQAYGEKPYFVHYAQYYAKIFASKNFLNKANEINKKLLRKI